MWFLSSDQQHHDIALIKESEDALHGNLGLNPCRPADGSGERELRVLHGQLLSQGTTISRTTDHGATTSVYFFDLDGS